MMQLALKHLKLHPPMVPHGKVDIRTLDSIVKGEGLGGCTTKRQSECPARFLNFFLPSFVPHRHSVICLHPPPPTCQVLSVNLSGAAWFTAAPWAVMAAAGILAGNVADWLLQSPPPPETDKRPRPQWGRIIQRPMSKVGVRKLMQSVGFLGPSFGLAALAVARRAEVASLLLTVVLACSAFSQAGFLLNHKDIAPRHAALLHGVGGGREGGVGWVGWQAGRDGRTDGQTDGEWEGVVMALN